MVTTISSTGGSGTARPLASESTGAEDSDSGDIALLLVSAASSVQLP